MNPMPEAAQDLELCLSNEVLALHGHSLPYLMSYTGLQCDLHIPVKPFSLEALATNYWPKLSSQLTGLTRGDVT